MDYLKIFFISMLPLVELRLAMPYAKVLGLPFWPALGVSVLGNLIPVPLIFYLARKILELGSHWPYLGRIFRFCLDKGHRAGQKLEKEARYGLYVALFLFVAIPLPGTGAWTGTLAASLLDLEPRRSFIAIASGVITAGLIMWLATSGLLAIPWPF